MQVPQTLTVNNAGQILEAGLQAIAKGRADFDLGDLASFDSAAVATLLAWQRAARARGLSLQLRRLPSGLSGLIVLYGVSGLLPVSA